jgi:xanthine dehydrogenase small subunit
LRQDTQGRTRFDAVNSCLVPAVSVHGRTIVTVEGVANAGGELHPVQRALVETGGSQCGYCTPGFVVSLFCEYYRPGRDAYDPECISGNLCRCTAYRPIAEAAQSLGTPEPGDPQRQILQTPPVPLAGFAHDAGEHRYTRPVTLAAALEQLDRTPRAVAFGGGTDLMVYGNLREERWSSVVSLDALHELGTFELASDELVIGGGLPLSELQERLRRDAPGEFGLLEQMLALFASRLIRNRATLGGNLATASPIGDSAPALLALDAGLTLVSAQGARRLPLQDFFKGYRHTALAAGELIHSIHVPRPAAPVQRFYKVSKRPLDDISTVMAAFALALDGRGRVAELRIAYGGIAETPLRARAVEQAARGLPWQASAVSPLAEALRDLGTPLSDHRGSAAYRRALLGSLFAKFYAETANLAELTA